MAADPPEISETPLENPSTTSGPNIEVPKSPEKRPEIPSPTNSAVKSPKDAAQEKEEEPPTLFYGYWKQGLYIKNPNKHFELKIGGKIMLDGGYLNSGSEIQTAFPDFYGAAGDFRKLSVAFSGNVWEKLDFKLEIDFANVQDIQDEWFRFPTIPVLKYLTFGHLKEPFSLENLSSLNYITFMEKALPNEPFAPGRNIGVLLDNRAKEDRRLTWALGWFLNTGSLSSVGDSRNQIDQTDGYNVSARVTGLPWYRDDGNNLLHLGVSYNYRNRDEAHSDSTIQFRARPESRLTDDRLIDTGDMTVEYVHIIDPEIAIVAGPLSFQGEFFYSWVNSGETYRFWGTYFYASVFLTGEHRIYNPSKGTFSSITPHENFELFGIFSKVEPDQDFKPHHGLGAFEIGARFSYMNLDDKDVQGGKEANVTVGLNWYFKSNARLILNYIYGNVKDREDPSIEDDWFNIFQARAQIYF